MFLSTCRSIPPECSRYWRGSTHENQSDSGNAGENDGCPHQRAVLETFWEEQEQHDHDGCSDTADNQTKRPKEDAQHKHRSAPVSKRGIRLAIFSSLRAERQLICIYRSTILIQVAAGPFGPWIQHTHVSIECGWYSRKVRGLRPFADV